MFLSGIAAARLSMAMSGKGRLMASLTCSWFKSFAAARIQDHGAGLTAHADERLFRHAAGLAVLGCRAGNLQIAGHVDPRVGVCGSHPAHKSNPVPHGASLAPKPVTDCSDL